MNGPKPASPATSSPASCRADLSRATSEGIVNVFGAPPVGGLGTAGGFKIVIEDRGDTGLDALQDTSLRAAERGRRDGGLDALFTSFRANTPWLYLDIDRAQAKTLGVSTAELFNTLQVNLGSLYVNDFNRFGRTWQVNVQASEMYRSQLRDLTRIQVRNLQGDMGSLEP